MDNIINLKLSDFADVLNGTGLEDEKSGHRGSHFEIVSTTAYLLGVGKRHFDNEEIPLMTKVYDKLDKDKRARIIRNLCIVRTQLEHNFLKVCKGIQLEHKSIMAMPEYIPSEAMKQLSDDGVNIYTSLTEPTPFLININTNIKSRINNCKSFFPSWLKWEYMADIFIMPDGLTAEGTKKAANFFYENINCYPYKVYMNWPAKEDGNILYNDKKFVTKLYEWNNDEFKELNLVSDASERTKTSIYSVIDNSEKCIIVVDCENSDPYRLCAAIRSLDSDKLKKIAKIILYDDDRTASAWEILKSYVDIPVEYILIERIKENKSLTDIKVATRVCKEYYSGNADTFILASSDSDYWGMIEDIPGANFLVMAEREKCSPVLKAALYNHNIPYCYLDSFYAGDAQEIKTDALQREISKSLSLSLGLNVNTIMENALRTTRISMTEEEVSSFVKSLKKHIELSVEDNGDIKLSYKMPRACKVLGETA